MGAKFTTGSGEPIDAADSSRKITWAGRVDDVLGTHVSGASGTTSDSTSRTASPANTAHHFRWSLPATVLPRIR